jgi:hypothetical protein
MRYRISEEFILRYILSHFGACCHSLKKIILPCVWSLAILVLYGCNSKSEVIVQSPTQQPHVRECVVLIHGMGRNAGSMSQMQTALVQEGYFTVNLGYFSTQKNVESIAAEDYPLALAACLELQPERVHFVTHSLGGIILRKALSEEKPDTLGRVVMLSPPNNGSDLVDTIKDWGLYKWLMGPAGQQLTTGKDSLPMQLGGADFILGIITGNRHAFFDSWFAFIISGVDDGKVSVENAKLEGMRDFLVMDETHPFIMNSEEVQRETIYFLRYGKFSQSSFVPESGLGGDWHSP